MPDLSEALVPKKFSSRAQWAFIELGVSTVGELIEKTRNDLLKINNFGQVTLNEITIFLAQRGLRLKGD